MTQPLYQLYRNIDYLLIEAYKDPCTDVERETIDRFWNVVDKNPKMLPEMRKTHGALLYRAVNGAVWEAETEDEQKWIKTFVSILRTNLKSPIYTGDALLNEYIQLRANLINSTFFKWVVCDKTRYGKPPYTPYESLLARLWGLPNSQPADEENGTVLQDLQSAQKLLERFIKQRNQPDNII